MALKEVLKRKGTIVVSDGRANKPIWIKSRPGRGRKRSMGATEFSKN